MDDPLDRFSHDNDSIETMVLTARFVGANPNPEVIGEGLMEYKCNYFIGNDPAKWRTDVPNYSAVTFKGICPGIDLRYSGGGTGQAMYELVVAPGADLARFRVQYDGAEETSIDPEGKMIMRTKWADILEVIASPVNGTGLVCPLLSLNSENSVGLTVDSQNRDHSKSLILTLSYSTFLGGTAEDYGFGIAVDGSGSAYVTGQTYSINFPTQNPYQTDQSGDDAFVTKLGELEFSCGDANADSSIGISDAVYLIAYIFFSGPVPNPLIAGDSNCNGLVNISDVVYLIRYIFSSGPEPCATCK